MPYVVYYLFDPLCGWCYGASAVVSQLDNSSQIQLKILPSGLFADPNSMPMDDQMAAYAWANDQRITQLTGQPFSELYRQNVLSQTQQRFDSGPATLVLSAVSMCNPEREIDALKVIQHERYVDGKDIIDAQVLTQILQTMGLTQAAKEFAEHSAKLVAFNAERIRSAQKLMHSLGIRGVPQLLLEQNHHLRTLNIQNAYSNPQSILYQITNA